MASRANAQIDLDIEDKKVRPALNRAERRISNFSKNAKKLLVGIGIGLAVRKLAQVGGEMLELAGEQERAEQKLESVLKATDNAAGFTADQLKAVAAGYQDITKFGDETIINAQAVLATFKNIRGDVFTDATEAMLDMATVLDTDLKGGAIQLGKALNDPIQGVAALTRVGVTFTDDQKDLIRTLQESGDIMGAQQIILDELSSQMGGAATGAAETFEGQMTQLGNKVGDVWEMGGFLLQEVLKPLIPVLMSAADSAMLFAEMMVPLAQNVAGAIIQFLEWTGILGTTQDQMIEWFAVIQVGFSRLPDLIASTLLSASAWVVEFANDIQYYLTEVVPHAAKSMWSIMKDVFFQLDDLILTVAGNIVKNMEDFVGAIKNALTGGDFDFEPTNLLEGFELKLNDLPELADKKSSELAAVLRESASDIDTSIGEDIAKAIDDAKTKAEEKKVGIDLTPNFEPIDPNAFKPKEKETKPVKLKELGEDKDKKKDKPDDSNEPITGTDSLTGMFDRIADAAREQAEFDPLIKTEEETQEILKTTAKDTQDAILSVGATFGGGLAGLPGMLLNPDDLVFDQPPEANIEVEGAKVDVKVEQDAVVTELKTLNKNLATPKPGTFA